MLQFDVCCKANDQNFDCGCDRCTILRLDSLIGVRCFPIHACPLLRRVVIVFASRTSFLRLRGLTFDATLDFSICAFFGLGRTTRSHVIFLGSVGPSCEKYLHVQSHSVFNTFRLHFAFVQRLKMISNKILEDVKFGGN